MLPSAGSLAAEDATLPQSEIAQATVAGASAMPSVKYFGDYELLSEIARGGMGVVYKARQVNLNRLVALKMILAGQFASDEDVKRFYTEAEAAAALEHPGIVPIFEIGQQNDQHFFSMGFIEGQSLADRISRGPLPPREATEMARKIAEAIAYAHSKGVIHRDLKPANVLLDTNGEPKITDFGLARKTEQDSGLTRTGAVMGTPSYMSPEQASGKTNEVGCASDLYSVGAILYCMLTGRPPFQAATPVDTMMQVIEQNPVPIRLLNRNVPNDLEAITLKCLSKSIGLRYSSTTELVRDLDRFLKGESVIASNSNWSNRLFQLVSRSRDDEQMRAWSSIIRSFSVIVLCTEVAIQILGSTGQLKWILATRVLQTVVFVAVLARNRKLWMSSLHPAILQMLSLWVAFFVACYLHVMISIEKKWLEGELSNLDYFYSYPTFLLFSGFLFSALGRQYWGGCYVIGACFFMLGLITPLISFWAPAIFGISWFVVLMLISRRLDQMSSKNLDY
jgi:serine/threonine protein kinase